MTSSHGAAILITAYDKRSIFSIKQVKIKSGKWENYSKVGVKLEVNNEVLVEAWMAKRYIVDYTSTSLHDFAYFVLHPSFKRPFFVGKNSN